jgi:hypothetical protein
MLFNQILAVIPNDTPIRIFMKDKPYEPYISQIYSDSARKRCRNLNDEIASISSQIIDGTPYLTITLDSD